MHKKDVKKFHCDGCGQAFELGDKIYLFHLWIVSRDYCMTCRDKVITFTKTQLPLHLP